MIHFTESMQYLFVISCDNEYMLTGRRYFDGCNYWYESCEEVWILGKSMKYADGRIR